MPTTTTTTFLPRDSFLREVQAQVTTLRDLFQRVDVVLSEQGYPLRKDTYHFLTRILQPSTRVERTMLSLLLGAAYQSEVLSAGSAQVAVQFALGFLEELLKVQDMVQTKNEVELMGWFERMMETYKENLQAHHQHISRETLGEQIEALAEDPTLSQAVQEALLVSGLEGKIHVEDGTTGSYVVEQKSGYSFTSLKPFRFMLPEGGIWEASGVKVLLVDGVLERVSELDKILNGAFQSKVPVLIVAHGFSEEVIATVKMNNDHNRFRVMPVRLSSDLDSLNVINDLAVVTGTDIVSTLKGDMVVFKEFDSLTQVEKVRVNPKELMIEHHSTRGNVSLHLRDLLEKRQSRHLVEDVQDLLDKRIQSLISAAVTLKLPNMPPVQRDATKVKIDILLRNTKTLLNYGQVRFRNLVNALSGDPSDNPLFKPVLAGLNNLLTQTTGHTLPALSAYVGVWCVGKVMLAMISSSGLVEQDTLT